MRIIFMGTPDFAVASLEALIQNHYDVVAVVTAADKPAGRGQLIKESAVKKYALKNNLRLLQPQNLKDEQFATELRSLQADLQIVVAFRMLPEKIWNMPPLGTFNLHASLLPKYRGAAPINWAIINGETRTGLTTFKLSHQIDTGAVLFQEEVEIGKDTNAGELHDVLKVRGAALVIKTVEALEAHVRSGLPLTFKMQNDEQATHAPKLYRETSRINWNAPGAEIHNLIRGLSPHPGAYTILHQSDEMGFTMKILRASFLTMEHPYTNGSLVTENGDHLGVWCNGGRMELSEVQLEGKRRMAVSEFLRGFKIRPGIFLS